MAHRAATVAPGMHPACTDCADVAVSDGPTPGIGQRAVVGVGWASVVPALVVERVGGADLESCCFCGALADQGYYARVGPDGRLSALVSGRVGPRGPAPCRQARVRVPPVGRVRRALRSAARLAWLWTRGAAWWSEATGGGRDWSERFGDFDLEEAPTEALARRRAVELRRHGESAEAATVGDPPRPVVLRPRMRRDR